MEGNKNRENMTVSIFKKRTMNAIDKLSGDIHESIEFLGLVKKRRRINHLKRK